MPNKDGTHHGHARTIGFIYRSHPAGVLMRPFLLWAALLALVPIVVLAASPTGLTLERALKLPAAELAHLCNSLATQKQFVALANKGVTVSVGSQRITKENAAKFAAELDQQLAVCATAGSQRGTQSVAGTWSGTQTGCERAGSMFAAMIAEPGTTASFTQEGTRLNLTLAGRSDDKSFSIRAAGAIVERAIVLVDPVNSDYTLAGELTGDRIDLRPDTDSVLKSWPAWDSPPKRGDLSACRVVLQRMADSSTPR